MAKEERLEFWRKTLHRVQRERLGREARAAIVTNDLKRAAQRSYDMLKAADNVRDQVSAAIVLGRALGELHRDRKRCEAVLGALMRSASDIDRNALDTLMEKYREFANEAKRAFEESNQTWLREQNEAIRSLTAFLPGPREAGEPNESELLKFQSEVEAMLKAAWRHSSPADLVDAIVVLSDYCPADPSPVRSLIGSEDRAFLNLGPKARLVAVRTLVRLGEQPSLRKTLVGLAGDDGLTPEEARRFAAFMGGLRHGDFLPFIKKRFEQASGEREEGWFSEPLSRISHPVAAALLEARLESLAKKFGDPRFERRACRMIEDLGRALRINREIDDATRNSLIRHAIGCLGERNREISAKAAGDLFRGRLDTIEKPLKNWAVERLVDMIWGRPPALGGPLSSGTEHGWREPYVSALARLGSECLDAMIAAAGRHTAQYSGAMASFSHVMVQIGDERAVAVLEQFITIALLHNTEEISSIQRETITDPASGQARELDRDDMVHSLFYAINKIGGEQGKAVALSFADRMQAGRLHPPGEKTAAFLMDLKQAAGALDRIITEREEVKIGAKTIKNAMSDAKGGLLTKKAKRVAAIATLGQARRPEAIETLLDCLGDKDAMIAGASHTALAEYLHPVPSTAEFSHFIETLFARPKAIKGEAVERLLAFIEREVPVNAPYDKIFEREAGVALVEHDELLFRVMAANRRPEKRGIPGSASSQPPGESQEGSPAASSPGISALDLKREYMQARRAWINGGKQGPEPKMPG